MADERQHDHKLCPNTIMIKNLTTEVERLRDENADLREKAIVGEERTAQIFEILGEIKISIKNIADAVQSIQTRPDPFKNEVYKFGLKLAEWALVGGMLYLSLQGKMP